MLLVNLIKYANDDDNDSLFLNRLATLVTSIPNIFHENDTLSNLIKYSDDDLKFLNKVKIFIAVNPNILNETDDEGWTMLHHAVYLSYENAVKELLSLGANPNVRDRHGMTPLHNAIYYGYGHSETILQLLLDHKADPNVVDNSNRNALHFAVYNITSNLSNVITLLIQAGVNLDVQDYEGSTALNILVKSSYNNNCDAIKVLIDAGANPTLQDNFGNYPLWVVLQRYFEDSKGDFLEEVNMFMKASKNHGADPLRGVLSCSGSKVYELANELITTEVGIDVNVQNRNGDTYLHIIDTKDVLDYEPDMGGYEWNKFTDPKDKKSVTSYGDWDTLWDDLWDTCDKKLQTKKEFPSNNLERLIKLLIDLGANLGLRNSDNLPAIHRHKHCIKEYVDNLIHESFKGDKVIDECCICMNDVSVIKCKYGHCNCEDCLVTDGTLNCGACCNRFIY